MNIEMQYRQEGTANYMRAILLLLVVSVSLSEFLDKKFDIPILMRLFEQ
jgi:hypothetical protein